MSGKGAEQRSKSGQFRKGQSGNPKGRPRKSKSAQTSGSAYDVIVDKTLSVMKGGAAGEVTVEEALQHATYRQAIDGNRAARREVLRMIQKREHALAKRASQKPNKIELRETYNPENAKDALMILGIGRRYDLGSADEYDRWKLEPWAVQAALRRRRGGSRLTEGEVAEIKRTTWEPETIVWPRGTLE